MCWPSAATIAELRQLASQGKSNVPERKFISDKITAIGLSVARCWLSHRPKDSKRSKDPRCGWQGGAVVLAKWLCGRTTELEGR